MARQTGDMKVVGTVEDLCFYKMQGGFFVRRKSSLSGKRFRKEVVFAGSRRSAGLLGRASSLAAVLYRQLPAENKSREVFRALTGAVRLRLRDGRTEEEIEIWFAQTYLPEIPVAKPAFKGDKKKKPVRFSAAVKQSQRPCALFLLPGLLNEQQRGRAKPGRRLQQLLRERGSPKKMMPADGSG